MNDFIGFCLQTNKNKLHFILLFIIIITIIVSNNMLSFLNTPSLSFLFSTLVLAEHNTKSLSKNSLKLLSAAKKFNEPIDVLVCGQTKQLSSSINSSIPSSHINKLYSLNVDHITSETVQKGVSTLHQKNKYKRVIALSSSFGKDVIPRLAGKYLTQPISDIVQIIDNKTFVRPTYAGNAMTKVKSEEDVDFITVRASAFQELQSGSNTVKAQQIKGQKGKVQFVSQQKSDSSKPQLTTSRIVISGGRGLKSKQNFDLIYKLAESFGDAAVGASRAAVDAGYCPNDLQVGQTGKVVAPDLYVAVGISGAVQHLAGMKDSKCIVAINNRPDEPIYEIADYTLEGDLFKVVPELTEKVKKIRG